MTTFKEINQQFIEHRTSCDALEQALVRRWPLPASEPRAGNETLEINIGWRQYHHPETGLRLAVSVYTNYRGPAFVGDMTARELRQVAAVMDLVRRFEQGEADLPLECPREILELR